MVRRESGCVLIAGLTAGGKSALALELAEKTAGIGTVYAVHNAADVLRLMEK